MELFSVQSDPEDPGRSPAASARRRGDCFTSHEVSRICGVAPITVGRWIHAGKLKAFRTVGGHRRILRSDLEAFLAEFRIPAVWDRAAPAARKVLVVDDDDIMFQVLRDMIATLPGEWEVKGARDGFEAGRLVATFRPQLVFLDLMMPGMDGFEVCQRVKADASTEGAEIVGLTGYFTPENRQRLLDCGAFEVLRKPVDLETLRKVLSKVFQARLGP
jgi:excisionase family DNA binding protein